MSIKISIITIVHHLIREKQTEIFRQNAASVKIQTYPNIEHIIINGTSDEEIQKLIQSCQHDRMRVFSESDNSIYGFMNKGLSQATGDYILYLDADDFLCRSNGIENCVRLLEKEDVDFLYASNRIMNHQINLVDRISEPYIGAYFVRMPFSHQAVLMKREKILALGGFDETFQLAGDYDFLIRLINSGAKGVYCPNEFSTFRTTELSDIKKVLLQQESIRCLEKNFSPICPECDWSEMFLNRKVPDKIIQYIIQHVDKSVCVEIEKVLRQSKCEENSRFIPDEPESLTFYKDLKGMYVGWLKLFGLIPIGQIKVLTDQIIYLIFNHPVLMINKNKRKKNATKKSM